MDKKRLDAYMDSVNKINDSLAVSVKISSGEVRNLVVNDLISKRNARSNDKKESFDVVLSWYLDIDDFERYVINGEPIL